MKWLGISAAQCLAVAGSLLGPAACFVSEEPEGVERDARVDAALQDALVDAAPRLDAVVPSLATVVINEVSAAEDVVELFNLGEEVALTGWVLVDGGYDAQDATTHLAHRLELSGTLPFGERVLVSPLPLGIADSVRLLDPSGHEIDRVVWGAGLADPAACRLPDGQGALQPCAPTPDLPNEPLPPASQRDTSVVINELTSSDKDGVELLNNGPEVIDLTGFLLADRSTLAIADGRYVFPSTSLEPGAYLVVEKSNHDLGLGRSDALWLLDPEGAVVDTTTWLEGAAVLSWCRIPNGSGPHRTCPEATLGGANTP